MEKRSLRQRVASFFGGEGSSPAPQMPKTGSLALALPKNREPLQSLDNLGISYDMADPETRKKVREWCRGYYATHSTVGTCIDIYSRFPIQDVEIECKDLELQEFYQDLFFGEDNLNYEQFLVDIGREFWTVGEVTTLGTFSDYLGVWTSEEILNPDDLTIYPSALSKEPIIRVGVPQYLKDLFSGVGMSDRDYPVHEIEEIKRRFPEVARASMTDEGLDVDPILLSRIVNKLSAWDLYGTPHLLRAFRPLMTEESLNAAQDAIADRLYTPFILAKLGMDRVDDSGPWIPTPEDLDNARDQINEALAADFKLLVHHHGIDIKSVFGRESMPRLNSDFDRAERKILQAWGIGESLLSGSTKGAYASSALNMQLVNQLMSTHQKWLQAHFRRRARVVAEAQGHYDYDILEGGARTPVYEEVLEVDPETNEFYTRRKPKLLVPRLKFKTLDLRDEAAQRQFLFTLKQAGIPISDELLVAGMDIDLNVEKDKVREEVVERAVEQAVVEKEILDELKKRGIDPESLGQLPPGLGEPTGDGGDSPNMDGLDENSPQRADDVPPSTDGAGVGETSQRPAISDDQGALF